MYEGICQRPLPNTHKQCNKSREKDLFQTHTNSATNLDEKDLFQAHTNSATNLDGSHYVLYVCII